jgi:XRE family aerobic/anaerobic benzoate catabolism transcriptional regulator
MSSQIETVSGMDVGEVISLYGQEGFRRYEEEAIASIIEDHDRVVIAVGGGIVEAAANYNLLLRHFHTIWVKASPGDHIGRVRAQGDERPMAGFAAAEEHLSNMLEQRAAEFSRADLVINTGGVDTDRSVEELQELINNHAIM